MNKFLKGITLSVVSAVLWGFGGTITQYLFNNSKFDYMSLVFLRFFTCGIILLLMGIYFSGKRLAIDMITNKKIFKNLLLYSIGGSLGLQIPFFATIQYSNAAFATLMQFWSPIFIIIYVSFITKKMPKIYELVLTFIILLGVVFIVSNGNLSTLAFDIRAVIWGLITAIGFSFYILYSKKFFSYPTTFTMGYSMLISFAIMALIAPRFYAFTYLNNFKIIIAFILLMTLGTVIPFCLFVESCRYISPKLTCILSVFEPVTSLIISISFLNVSFGYIQLVGVFIIIVSTILISAFSKD